MIVNDIYSEKTVHQHRSCCNMKNVEADGGDAHQSLIPGMEDDFTLQQIATKISWTTINTLAQVSGGWRQAVQERKVYDARVCASSSQTLVPLMHSSPHNEWLYSLSLYEPSTDKWNLLPGIPGVETGFPRSCGHACFNGKLYVLGGVKQNNVASRELYVLDLGAGNTRWNRLADMHFSRSGFLCDVKDGKIYVFGGLAGGERSSQVEVFDSEQNSWSPVAPNHGKGWWHKLASLGGKSCERGCTPGQQADCCATNQVPCKDHWENLNKISRGDQTEGLVEVDQRVLKIDLKATYLMNDVSQSWECYQPILWRLPVYKSSVPSEILEGLPAEFLARKPRGVNFLQAVGAVGGEILTLTRVDGFGYPSLFKSKGFGSESQQMFFEDVSCSHKFIFDQTSFVPIHL